MRPLPPVPPVSAMLSSVVSATVAMSADSDMKLVRSPLLVLAVVVPPVCALPSREVTAPMAILAVSPMDRPGSVLPLVAARLLVCALLSRMRATASVEIPADSATARTQMPMLISHPPEAATVPPVCAMRSRAPVSVSVEIPASSAMVIRCLPPELAVCAMLSREASATVARLADLPTRRSPHKYFKAYGCFWLEDIYAFTAIQFCLWKFVQIKVRGY